MSDWLQDALRKDSSNKACIVLIHGFRGSQEKTWAQFLDQLLIEPSLRDWDLLSFGYKSSFIPDLAGIWIGDPSIQTIADSLRTFAETRLSHYGSLAFIAHSMGGLVVQRALLDQGTMTAKVDKVMNFGTPSFGLVKASPFNLPILNRLKRQVGDLAADSPFITKLRRDWDQMSKDGLTFDFLAVAGSEDEFVPRSASIEGFPDHQCAVVPGTHCKIVRPEGTDDASVSLATRFISGAESPRGPWGSADLALERRQFNQVVAKLGPHRDELDTRARVSLALALDALGRRGESMAVLEGAERFGADAMGVLAGRYKRNWLHNRKEKEAQEAVDLYTKAFEKSKASGDPAQAFYHGINCAFLTLVYEDDFNAAREKAQEVLVSCARARDGERPEQRMWRLATEGEAYLVLGNLEKALARYRSSLEGPPKPRPWQVGSMFEQACWIAEHLGEEEIAQAIVDLFVGSSR